MGFRQWRGFGNTTRQQLRRRNEKQRRRYLARQYEHLLFEPLEWRNLLTATLRDIVGNDAGGVFNVPSGKTLYVPLTGSDNASSSATISYTAQSSNSGVNVEVIDGRPTLELNVSGTDGDGNPFSGKLTIELFNDIAPTTVQTIVNYVNAGDYDGKSFYRVVQDFIIQGGLGQGDHGLEPFDDEFDAQAAFNSPGLLAMANPGTADSNTSEFFITDIDLTLEETARFLNFKHTIFGQLTSGFDIYEKIIGVNVTGPNNDDADPPITITDANIISGGDQNAILKITAVPDFDGTATITVTTSTSADSSTASDTFGVDFSPVAPSSSQPVVIAPVSNKTVQTGKSITFQIAASLLSGHSLNSDKLTVTGTNGFRGAPQNVTVNVVQGANNTAMVTLTSAANFVGKIELVVHADTNTGRHDAMLFTLEVQPTIDSVSPANIASGAVATVKGNGSPGATISITATDGTTTTSAVTTTVGNDGNWSKEVDVSSLADGTITYMAEDTTNDVQAANATGKKDMAAPSVTLDAITSPITVGTINVGGTVDGIGSDGGSVKVVIDDNDATTAPVQRTVTVNANGTWSITGINIRSLKNGPLTFTATATDAANNPSTSDTKNADKDVPDNSISGFVYVDVNKNNRKDSKDAVLRGVLITLTGVDFDGNPLPSRTTTTDANGRYRFNDLPAGVYTVREAQPSGMSSQVTNVGTVDGDQNGNGGTNVVSRIRLEGADNGRNYNFGEKGFTSFKKVTINDFLASTPPASVQYNNHVANSSTASPVVKSITKLDSDPTDDSQVRYRVTFNKSVTGVNASDFRVISNGTIDDASIDGVSGSGKTYTVTVNTGVGSGQLGLALRDNDSIIDSKKKALGGNGSGNGNFVAASYTVAKVSFVQITSNIPTINAANDNSVPISGTGEVGAIVTVVARNGTMVTDEETTTVGEDGTWSIPDFDVSDLPDGTIVFTATATNQTGDSAPSNRNAIKDTVGPTVTIDPISGTINAADAASFDVSGTVDGTGDEDTTITLVVDDNDNMTPAVERTITVDSDGAWMINDLDLSDLDDGTLTFTVKATDSAGNESAEDMVTATKDTVGPTVAINQPETINSETDETSITVTGTGEVGAMILLTISNGSATVGPLNATVGMDGTWSIDDIDVSSLPDGMLTFFATATDDAENPTTASRTAVKDTDAPDVMSITLADADPTSALTVHFTVVFSEAVTGVGTSSFMTAAGGDVTGVTIDGVSGTGNIYTVTVSFTSGAGTLGLNVVDTDLIFDLANNPLGGVGDNNGDFTGPAYTIEASGGAAEALLAGSDDESTDEFFGELASA